MEIEKVGRFYRTTLVNGIKERVQKSNSTFLMTFTAVSSARLGGLRKTLHRIGAQVFVSKNRIAKIALKELNQEKLAEKITGQTAFIWTDADSIAVSKALMKFAKDQTGISVPGGLFEGSLLGQDDVKRLSDLPAREVLLSQLLGTMMAPLNRLGYVLNAKSCDLLSILKQLGEKRASTKDS
jgi:large subunit ribosomal protein L10